MKIIKSFVAILALVSSATLLHAQENKTQIARPVEAKIPVTDANRTSPEPVFKPQPQVGAVTAVQAAAETPSPQARDKNQQPATAPKPVTKIADDKDVITPGGEEGRNIMAGKTTRPAPEINNQSTVDPRPAPPVKTPATLNGRQQ